MSVKALLFSLRINVYAIALAALWIPLNLIVLPGRVDELVPGFLRGSGLGLLTVVGVGTAALLQPVAGRLSDLSPLPDRRKPFIAVATGLMVALLLGVNFAPLFWLLLIAYVALQVASNFAQAALQAWIPDQVEEKDRGTAAGVKTALDAFGIVVGLAAASLLLDVGSGKGGFVLFLSLLLAGCAVWSVLFVPRVKPLPEAERGGGLRESLSWETLKAPFVELTKASEEFRSAILMRFLLLLGLFVVQRFLLYFLEERFGVDRPAEQSSIYLLAGFVLAGIGAAGAGPVADAVGRGAVLKVTIIASAAMVAGIAVAPVLAIVIVCGAVLALATGAFQAANWALLSDTMDQKRGGQFYGLANLATAGAGALAGIFGPLIDLVTPVGPSLAYGVVFGLAALVALSSLMTLRQVKSEAAV